MQISDIRGAEQQFTLDTNGFQVVKNDWPETKVDATDQDVKITVYLETVSLLKKMWVQDEIFDDCLTLEIANNSQAPVLQMSSLGRIKSAATLLNR